MSNAMFSPSPMHFRSMSVPPSIRSWGDLVANASQARVLHFPLDTLTKDLPVNCNLFKLAQCKCFLRLKHPRPICRYRVFICTLNQHSTDINSVHYQKLEEFFLDIFGDSEMQFINDIFSSGSSHVKALWISCYVDDKEQCSSALPDLPPVSKSDSDSLKLAKQDIVAAVVFHCNPGMGACIRYIGTSNAGAGSKGGSIYFRKFDNGTTGLWQDGPTSFRGIGLGQFLIHLVQVHNVFDIKTYSSLVFLSATHQGGGWYRRMGFINGNVEVSWPECYQDFVGDLGILYPMMTTMPIPPIKEWNQICYFSDFLV